MTPAIKTRASPSARASASSRPAAQRDAPPPIDPMRAMADIDDDDADVMTDDDEMTTANVKGSVIHVRVAHDRQMPGVVWENFHNKDQQVKYWNLAVQSKGEGKGA
jgi:hypothetical protein